MASDEPLTDRAQNGHRTSKVQLAALSARQAGCVTWAQLRTLGAAPGTIRRWCATGYLIRVLPRVYAVGHLADDERTRLVTLVLFAGPGAAISHGTSAYWRGWLRYPSRLTHLSTPRRIRAGISGVTFHGCRPVSRELVRGVPCTDITRTLLDVAAAEPERLLHRCLAQLDYERRLDRAAILELCGPGRPGSAALLRALDAYAPQLARTRSELEDEFLHLCRRHDLPLPEVNVIVHGLEVDCHWPELGLVVELDGHGNHATASQRTTDQRRAIALRAHGLGVIRYTREMVFLESERVARDLGGQIGRRRRLTYPA
ncbi:MAG TPA: type IV toxin-antitoxin system AbiEi family antitoxin domain-containing protein [Solirubrobacteraceae bacterium]|nr:type IV toxin-antitoxin system AbiEi family antitoxin domain-containing protein [Solirubrobacteraceae bacterium]